LHFWAGKIAGIVSLIAFIPYCISAIQGKNRPNRATWFIWFFVSLILLASYRSAGATDAIWVSVANVFIIGLVALLSIKYGEGGFNLFDISCFLGAMVGLVLWWFLRSPLPALYISVIIDFIGALPTLKKSYLNPHEENRLTWALFWLANTINLFAINQWTWAMAAYPLYLFFISGTILWILVFRSEKNTV